MTTAPAGLGANLPEDPVDAGSLPCVPMPRPRTLLPLAVAVIALVPAACGGSDSSESRLIGQTRSQALLRSLDRVEGDVQGQHCVASRAEVDRLRAQVNDLPKRTDGGLVANLTQWVDHLEQRVPEDCQAAAEPTPSPAETATPPEPTGTATSTPTPSATPDKTATPTPTPTPGETATPTPTPAGGAQSPDAGGASPQGDG